MKVVYVGNSDGCIVQTDDGVIDVRKGESIDLKGIQLQRALSMGFIEKYLYDEEIDSEDVE